MFDTCQLLINGVAFSGWSEVTVNRSMEAIAGGFSLTTADTLSARTVKRIRVQDECEIVVNGEPLITGYVDRVDPSFSRDQVTRTVQGRDRTGDLVDCSAVYSPDEWAGLTLLQLAAKLSAPFGIAASAEGDVGGPIPKAKVQPGETVLSALARYAQLKQRVLMPDKKGGLLITKSGSRRASVVLEQGVNIVSGRATVDFSQRFSSYSGLSQAPFNQWSEDGAAEAHISAKAADPAVLRYRPMLLANTQAESAAALQEAANWESRIRLARSVSCTIEVVGWRQGLTGQLWEPNILVRVQSPMLDLAGDMLISGVTFTQNARDGTRTRLELVSPQAFDPEPIKLKAPKENPWGEAEDDDGDV